MTSSASSCVDDAPAGPSEPARRWPAVVATVVAIGVAVTLAGWWFSPIGERWRADADGAPPLQGVSTIDIVDSTFGPASVQVERGAELTWRWLDGEGHDVVFDDGVSSSVQSSGTWSRTFDEPGTYTFTCTLHRFMDGRVVVDP